MRWLYSLAWYLVLPVVAVVLLFKPAWRRGWRARLGLIEPNQRRGIWVLAASVGEVQAALPLIEALRMPSPDESYARFPRLIRRTLATPDVITTQTDADADRLLALGADPTRVTVGGNLKVDFELPAGLAADDIQGGAARDLVEPGRE